MPKPGDRLHSPSPAESWRGLLALWKRLQAPGLHPSALPSPEMGDSQASTLGYLLDPEARHNPTEQQTTEGPLGTQKPTGTEKKGASLVDQKVKNPPAVQETWVRSLGCDDPLEKEMATHSSILAQRVPWTEKPGGLQSMGSQRVGHD